MDNTKSILIVGVGGQGTLLASKLMGHVLIHKGYDVKVSEVHGMSQRGGSVVTYVRYGSQVHSPLIELGEADYILSFEQLEAARYLSYLKLGGTVVANSAAIDPMPVITGVSRYPEHLLEEIKARSVALSTCDALELARQAGNAKAVNVVLIGLFAKQMPFDGQDWKEAIKATVPARLLDVNMKAFELGYQYQDQDQCQDQLGI